MLALKGKLNVTPIIKAPGNIVWLNLKRVFIIVLSIVMLFVITSLCQVKQDIMM